MVMRQYADARSGRSDRATPRGSACDWSGCRSSLLHSRGGRSGGRPPHRGNRFRDLQRHAGPSLSLSFTGGGRRATRRPSRDAHRQLSPRTSVRIPHRWLAGRRVRQHRCPRPGLRHDAPGA